MSRRARQMVDMVADQRRSHAKRPLDPHYDIDALRAEYSKYREIVKHVKTTSMYILPWCVHCDKPLREPATLCSSCDVQIPCDTWCNGLVRYCSATTHSISDTELCPECAIDCKECGKTVCHDDAGDCDCYPRRYCVDCVEKCLKCPKPYCPDCKDVHAACFVNGNVQ